MLLPPIPPPPLAPLQLLGSTTSDYLAQSTTLHQHTQTHSTRLVALTTADTNKRKIPIPQHHHTLIKIESDCTSTPPMQDHQQSTKTLQTVSTMANTNSMFAEQNITPLLTTHVFYQHPTNLIQIAQPQQQLNTLNTSMHSMVPPQIISEALCRSQVSSPATYLTPPPEIISEMDDIGPGVMDASNQTDTPICSEDDSVEREELEEPVKIAPMIQVENEIVAAPIQIATAITTQITEVRPISIPITIMSTIEPPKSTVKITEIIEEEIPEITKEVVAEGTDEGSRNVDLSGLELLSNSIVELEHYREEPTPCRKVIKIEKIDEVEEPMVETVEAAPEIEKEKKDDEDLGGLGL